MTHRDTSFAAYRPWGHVRRRNLIGRVLYAVSMAVLGLGALAGVALLAVFAASVALAVSFAVAVVGFYATLRHKPAHVRVRASEGGEFVNFHCRVDPAMSVADVHERIDRVERGLRREFPEIRRVISHAEPARTDRAS